MRTVLIALCVMGAATLPNTASAQSEDNQATKRWQAQVQDQPIRAAASVQDEFKTDQVTVSLEFSSVHQTFDGLITTLRRRKTDIIREAEVAGMRVAEATITAMELRQHPSDSDDFGYFGDVTVLLTVTGFTDPLDVAARLNRLPARSVGELQYSLSKTALERAEDALRNQVLAKIQREAASEAELRNTQLGDMLRFEFETHVNRRSPKAVNVVIISGRGLAVFKPHGQQ
jgi:hypothetical protein